jgi:hypothetical protein
MFGGNRRSTLVGTGAKALPEFDDVREIQAGSSAEAPLMIQPTRLRRGLQSDAVDPDGNPILVDQRAQAAEIGGSRQHSRARIDALVVKRGRILPGAC